MPHALPNVIRERQKFSRLIRERSAEVPSPEAAFYHENAYPNWFLNVSVPAGQTIQFKFLKIAANGTVTWENGSNHFYTVPTSGVSSVNVN